MTDNTPPSPKAPKQPHQNPRTPRKKMSREMQWIGLIVLVFGVLAVSAVGLFAYQRFSAGAPRVPSAEQVQGVDTAVQTQAAESAAPQASPAPPVSQAEGKNSLLSSMRDMRVERPASGQVKGEDVNVRAIRGVWEINSADNSGVIELAWDGQYRLLIAGSGPVRFFSNGTYEMREGGTLVFMPDSSIRPPQDDYLYQTIYSQPFAVQVAMQNKYMIWSPAQTSVGFFQPSVHPFLKLVPDNMAVWEPM